LNIDSNIAARPTCCSSTKPAKHQFLKAEQRNRKQSEKTKMADREQPVTLRTRKFLRNALLQRKQMVV
jgi:hypothetical protein